jgi:phenylalanyl-tRNA synthetase beta chain
MKFTLFWLKEHLATEAGVDEVAATLTRIGLEVEGIDNPGETLAAFRVARVLSAERHPQADKLQVLSVDAGDGPLQVVCGAPNARAGMLGVFGAPGAYVPGSGITLKVAAIRGVESNGMMCSSRELQLGDDHDGIIELPADAPVGASYANYAGLTDPVFDVAITPNRQDCMGVRGIARDLAAAGLGTLKPLEQVYRGPVRGRGARPRGPHRRSGRLPGLLRAGRDRRHEWPVARMDAPLPDRDRAEADLVSRRHHQLRHDRPRAPAPRL